MAEPEQPGWKHRKLLMSCLTNILEEQWGYTSKRAKPKIGNVATATILR